MTLVANIRTADRNFAYRARSIRGALRAILSLAVLYGCLSPTGCRRTPQLEYTSSAETKQLKDELRTKIVALLNEHCGTPQAPKLLGDDKLDLQHLIHGRDVYTLRCAQCHGTTGDGSGPAAASLYPRPRDYRRGFFKFTSTPYGAKPRKADLLRTVRRGIPGTSMPAFDLLPEKDLAAVVDYVVVLTHRGELEFQLTSAAAAEDAVDPDGVSEAIGDIRDAWKRAESEVVYPVTPEPPLTKDNVVAGKQAFLTRGCSKCHGEDGRGQTPDNLRGDLKDAWGHVTRAADLTSGMLHGGQEPIDIYRRIFSGVNGTPMPGFKSSLAQEPETMWNLVAYVLYLSNERRRGKIPEAGVTAPWPPRPVVASDGRTANVESPARAQQ